LTEEDVHPFERARGSCGEEGMREEEEVLWRGKEVSFE